VERAAARPHDDSYALMRYHKESSMKSEPRIIRRKALAERLGVSLPTLDRWTRSGRIPKPKKLGARIVGWPSSTVDSFVCKLARQGC
jgi:predicted DNA-binding transcriptional regulator AlpA